MRRLPITKIAAWGLGVLIVNTAYLAAFAHADHFLQRQRAAASGVGLVLAAAAIPWARRYPRECGAFLLAGRSGALPGDRRQHVGASLGIVAAHRARGDRGDSHRGTGIRRRRRPPLSHGLCAGARHFAAAARRQHDLPDGASGSGRSHSESTDAAALDERRRRRAAIAVLAVVGADQYRAASFPRTSSWIRSPAASATRTSTSSGRARCTTSLRSTTSSIASPSSTCRT